MKEFTYVVTSRAGMHMRPAMEIFHLAHNHQCYIEMTCNGKTLHAKMVMDMMSLSAKKGDSILFQITGDDETLVYEKLKNICRKML